MNLWWVLIWDEFCGRWSFKGFYIPSPTWRSAIPVNWNWNPLVGGFYWTKLNLKSPKNYNSWDQIAVQKLIRVGCITDIWFCITDLSQQIKKKFVFFLLNFPKYLSDKMENLIMKDHSNPCASRFVNPVNLWSRSERRIFFFYSLHISNTIKLSKFKAQHNKKNNHINTE